MAKTIATLWDLCYLTSVRLCLSVVWRCVERVVLSLDPGPAIPTSQAAYVTECRVSNCYLFQSALGRAHLAFRLFDRVCMLCLVRGLLNFTNPLTVFTLTVALTIHYILWHSVSRKSLSCIPLDLFRFGFWTQWKLRVFGCCVTFKLAVLLVSFLGLNGPVLFLSWVLMVQSYFFLGS